jgi:hypothetical protein
MDVPVILWLGLECLEYRFGLFLLITRNHNQLFDEFDDAIVIDIVVVAD